MHRDHAQITLLLPHKAMGIQGSDWPEWTHRLTFRKLCLDYLDFYPVSGPCILGPRVSLLQWFLRKTMTVVWFHVKAQPQKPALNLKCSPICHLAPVLLLLQSPLPPCSAVSAPRSFWLTLCLSFYINFSLVYICVWYTCMYVWYT